jgi:predicted transcriptional regulator
MLEKIRSEVELVGRHLRVVSIVAENQPIGIMKLAELTGLPAHRVRYSLKVLEGQGYIQASPAGAMVTETATKRMETLDSEIDAIIALLETMRKENSTNQ